MKDYTKWENVQNSMKTIKLLHKTKAVRGGLEALKSLLQDDVDLMEFNDLCRLTDRLRSIKSEHQIIEHLGFGTPHECDDGWFGQITHTDEEEDTIIIENSEKRIVTALSRRERHFFCSGGGARRDPTIGDVAWYHLGVNTPGLTWDLWTMSDFYFIDQVHASDMRMIEDLGFRITNIVRVFQFFSLANKRITDRQQDIFQVEVEPS